MVILTRFLYPVYADSTGQVLISMESLCRDRRGIRKLIFRAPRLESGIGDSVGLSGADCGFTGGADDERLSWGTMFSSQSQMVVDSLSSKFIDYPLEVIL